MTVVKSILVLIHIQATYHPVLNILINNFGFDFVVPVNYNEWNFCDGNNDCPEGLDLCQPHEIATGGKFDKKYTK